MDRSCPRARPACTRLARATLLIVLLGVPACHLAEAASPAAVSRPKSRTFEVKEVPNVAYYTGRDADPIRHRLDLFLPKGQRDYPVVVLLHGGAWMIGDKSCLGLYSNVGRFLARHGIGAVLPNYRLSPWVRHPEHVRDVARAFAWTRKHIARYGGDPHRLFLAGHSAGGHLVALLATDGRYLKAEGLEPSDVRGVVCVSGVYRIPPGMLEVTLGGKGPEAFGLEQLVFWPGGMGAKPLSGVFGRMSVPLTLNFFGPAFGDDPKVRADASPLTHVHRGLPPFLLFSAEHDLPYLAGMATRFHDALRKDGCDARLVKVAGRNHNTVFFQATSGDDPVAREMLEFIHTHAR
jgi:acetyl esterase/lipase